MNNKSNNTTIALNMIANMLSFVVSMVISFFLTPYIASTVGIEAYGLVGLANSFIGYISIVTIALNSMASRFIIVNLHKGATEKANQYFSSALLANTIFAGIISIPAILLIININILNISGKLLFDAKMTFLFVYLTFVINLIGGFYGIVLYAKNILWKGAFRTLEANILRVLLILFIFKFVSGKIYNVVLVGAITGIYVIFWNYYYTKKYLPELFVRRTNFRFSAIKELVVSGIWNSITKVGHILLDGLDLLLSNLFISGVMTGNVSIAKTIPSLYTSVVSILSDSFYPEFLELYSKNRKEDLIQSINKSINILSGISGICLSILIVYAKEFYVLWVPECDADLLWVLTILSVGTVLISGCIYSLFSIFSLTNKIRINSVVILLTGALSSFTTFALLKNTNLGVYAIVGVSSIYGILRNLLFTPAYAAKCLGEKWYIFYPRIIRNLLNIVVLLFIDSIIKNMIPPNTWPKLFANGVIAVLIGGIITVTLVFSKTQKQEMFNKLKCKINRKKM